jgi:two-component sensor histidine kinase
MADEWVRHLCERALEPYSLKAFLFAGVCVGAATAVRYLLGFYDPYVLIFAAHYPAILIVTLVAGLPAAIFATVLSMVLAGLLFIRPLPELALFNSLYFALSCAAIILIGSAYRRLLMNYQAQERHKNLMLRELEHRSKNTHSVVEAIVTQSLAGDREAAETIVGRIRAIAATDDVINAAEDLQPDLRTLIRSKFGPFGQYRAALQGHDIRLMPDAARNLSLVFHELVINAIKHGAMSRPEGRVDISWKANGVLTIEWVERGGPVTSPPERRGFGSRLVSGCMRNLGGSARMEFLPEGLHCTLTLPYVKALNPQN